METAAGLYIHVPFCETKCGYCDFYSVALKDRETAPLVDAVIRELESRVANASLRIGTIFCGGGTPTLLPFEQLQRLLQAINRIVEMDVMEEFTVEANPATVNDDKAALLRKSGVTRVSMGAQSFFPEELVALERLHSPADIPSSVETLRRCGIANVNLDLIFGIPGQTMDSWQESLERAIELDPDHISCYGLTYEPATKLTAQRDAGRVVRCDEDTEAEMFLATIEMLESAGYLQYEISNYAKPGCECLHNLIYWRNKPYIGVGPSAAGCYRTPSNAELRRHKNVPDVARYVRMMTEHGNAEIESEVISGEKLIDELIMMQLRLGEGLSIDDFKARTGLDPRDVFADTLPPLIDQGLLTTSDTHIVLTRKGQLVANAVMEQLSVSASRTIALPIAG